METMCLEKLLIKPNADIQLGKEGILTTTMTNMGLGQKEKELEELMMREHLRSKAKVRLI